MESGQDMENGYLIFIAKIMMNIKEIMRMIKKMGLEFINGLMDLNIKDLSKMI